MLQLIVNSDVFQFYEYDLLQKYMLITEKELIFECPPSSEALYDISEKYKHLLKYCQDTTAESLTDAKISGLLVELSLMAMCISFFEYTDTIKQHVISEVYLKNFWIDFPLIQDGYEGKVITRLKADEQNPSYVSATPQFRGSKKSWEDYMEIFLSKIEWLYGTAINPLELQSMNTEMVTEPESSKIGGLGSSLTVLAKISISLMMASLTSRVDTPNAITNKKYDTNFKEEYNEEYTANIVFSKLLAQSLRYIGKYWAWVFVQDVPVLPFSSYPVLHGDHPSQGEIFQFPLSPKLLLIAHDGDPFTVNIDIPGHKSITKDLLKEQRILSIKILTKLYNSKDDSGPVINIASFLVSSYADVALKSYDAGNNLFWYPNSIPIWELPNAREDWKRGLSNQYLNHKAWFKRHQPIVPAYKKEIVLEDIQNQDIESATDLFDAP